MHGNNQVILFYYLSEYNMINSIISDIISTVNSQLLSTADIDSLLLDNYFHDSQRELAPLT
jgi:hypothetical protein